MDTEHDLGSLKGSFSIALDFVLAFFEWGEEISDEKKNKNKISNDPGTSSCFPLETGNC